MSRTDYSSRWHDRPALRPGPSRACSPVRSQSVSQADARKFSGPTNSSPIALSADGKLRLVRQPRRRQRLGDPHRARTRSSRRSRSGTSRRASPSTPNNRYAYVANAAASTVTVIRITRRAKKQLPGGRLPRRASEARSQPAPSRGTSSPRPTAGASSSPTASQDTITVIDASEAKGRQAASRAQDHRQREPARQQLQRPGPQPPLPAARPRRDEEQQASSTSQLPRLHQARRPPGRRHRQAGRSSAASTSSTQVEEDPRLQAARRGSRSRPQVTGLHGRLRPATACPTRRPRSRTSCRAS